VGGQDAHPTKLLDSFTSQNSPLCSYLPWGGHLARPKDKLPLIPNLEALTFNPACFKIDRHHSTSELEAWTPKPEFPSSDRHLSTSELESWTSEPEMPTSQLERLNGDRHF